MAYYVITARLGMNSVRDHIYQEAKSKAKVRRKLPVRLETFRRADLRIDWSKVENGRAPFPEVAPEGVILYYGKPAEGATNYENRLVYACSREFDMDPELFSRWARHEIKKNILKKFKGESDLVRIAQAIID